MKSSIKTLFIIILISTFIASCTSPKKLLEKGNYYEAVMLAVEKLKKNPSNKKAQETLQEAYHLAVDNLLNKLERDKLIQPQFANSAAAYTYGDLNRLYEKVQQSPMAKQIIRNPEKFYPPLAKAKPLAAEEQYKAGIEQLSIGKRENAKQAYYYFQDANAFVKNYKDVSDKIEESYNLSLLIVLANLKPVQSRMYDLSADVFYNEVKNILNQIEQNEFVRFYTPRQAKEMNLNKPDQILSINFEDFVVGETHTKERIEKMQADSVKVGQITLDDGTKKDVFGSVKAKVSINRMEVISRGIINLNIIQKDYNEVLINQDFAGEYVWFNEWGNYNGDKRALTKNQIEICNRRRTNPIPPQQMFVEFTKPIHDQLRRRLFNFYNGY